MRARDAVGVILDASYFIGSPRNKVHDYDACYPGSIQSWKQRPAGNGPAVKCGQPYGNNHVVKCGPFDRKGDFEFEACGRGYCGTIVVSVW